MGCAGIKVRPSRKAKYVPSQLKTSNKGWHSQWFNLKNDEAAPLPAYTSETPKGKYPSWSDTPSEIEHLGGTLKVLESLRKAGLKMSDIIDFKERSLEEMEMEMVAGTVTGDPDVITTPVRALTTDCCTVFPPAQPAMLPNTDTERLVGNLVIRTTPPLSSDAAGHSKVDEEEEGDEQWQAPLIEGTGTSDPVAGRNRSGAVAGSAD